MDKKGNSAADRDQLPPITLFGKRMKLTGPASEPPAGPARHIRARRGREDAEERRVFWVAVGVFAAVLLAALLGPRLVRQKDGIPVTPPEVPPQPAATVTAPDDTSAASALALKPPATDAAKPGGGEPARAQAGSTPTSPTPTKVRAAGRPAQGKPQARRRPARDEAYIRRLRDQMQQYEREKAQGEYQESPQ